MITRTALIALLFLSGCAAMPSQEQIRAQKEYERVAQVQREEQERKTRETLQREAQEADRQELEARKKKAYEKAYRESLYAVMEALIQGERLRSKALVTIHDAAIEKLGQFHPDEEEYWLYAIAVTERAEAGKFSKAEARFLIAQKKAEIVTRLENKLAAQEAKVEEEERADEQRKDRELNAIIEMQRVQEQQEELIEQRRSNEEARDLNLMLLLNRQQTRPAPYPNLPLSPQIHCTSRSFLGTVTTDCQ